MSGAPETVRDKAAGGTAEAVSIASGAFLEAAGDAGDGGTFRIRAIRAGLSGNGNYYPDAALRAAVPLFERARVLVKSDAEHLSGGGKDVRNLIGDLREAAFVAGAGPDGGEVQARLRLIEPDGAVAVKLREAVKRGMADLFGFSINARADIRRRAMNGRPVREAVSFVRINSVDLIVEPGAGGELIGLLEAKRDTIMDRQQVIDLLRDKGLLAGRDVDKLSDDDLLGILTQAVGPTAGKQSPAGKDASGGDTAGKDAESRAASPPATQTAAGRTGTAQTPPAQPPAAQSPAGSDTTAGTTAGTAAAAAATVAEAVRRVEARAAMREAVGASGLPAPAKARVIAGLETSGDVSETRVAEAIKTEADYLGQFAPSGRLTGLGAGGLVNGGIGGGPAVSFGESRADKVRAMFEAFFDPGHKDHRHAQSFRECYAQATGDRRITGRLTACDRAVLRESLDSTSFGDVLGDAITRRMVADYRAGASYDIWMRLASVVPIQDFRTQERTRFGGYGDIPAVSQGAAYASLTSPADEKATYAVSKRGGTEDVTIEMIANDDVGAIRRIPMRMARAAKRTLARFALDFLKDNANIYDGVALFHASHNNLGTAALAAAGLAAGRLAMLKQTEAGSGDRLGIGPKYLWVPPELEETAVNLFRRSTENDRTFQQSLSLEVMPVWYWSDATDWCLSADPMDIPTVEVGFLNGAQEPELFVQDNPTQGSLFTHDKVTYKLRHVYGGAVVDYRGLYKSVVTG